MCCLAPYTKDRMGPRFGIGSLSIVMTLLLSLAPKLEAELTTVEQATKSDGSISFLVIGDWGRRGLYNQTQVALQMGRIGEKMDIDFVVSTGDNIYDKGMKSIDDPAFQLSFTNIYTSPSLQKPWYLVLGNHDYRGDVEAQLSPLLRSIDSRWICMRSFIVDDGIAELFFVDTTPFVNAYFLNPDGQNYDWRGVSPRESYLQTILTELEMSLRSSRAKWKIVVGHHAIKSASIHGNTKELESLLLPILEANNVDLYVNGHDHCLQHISTSQSPIQFLTSGAGSKAWRGYYNWTTPEDMKFFYDGQGFMSSNNSLHRNMENKLGSLIIKSDLLSESEVTFSIHKLPKQDMAQVRTVALASRLSLGRSLKPYHFNISSSSLKIQTTPQTSVYRTMPRIELLRCDDLLQAIIMTVHIETLDIFVKEECPIQFLTSGGGPKT